jgi:hypothetical protein
VSNIFVFAMDGTIRICGINAPGTMYDSSVSDYSFVYEKLKEMYQLMGSKVVIDLLFVQEQLISWWNLPKQYQWATELMQ